MSDPIVTFDESAIKDELGEPVRKTVEETVNALLEEEADSLVGAERYERTASREAYRAGHYGRKPATASGTVNVEMPKPKGARFTAAATGRYRRREASAGEAAVETCLAGASARRIEDVGEAPWGASVSAGTAPDLDEKAFRGIEEWRPRPLACEYRYVYVDGIYLKRSWGGSLKDVAAMAAIGVDGEGCREAIGCAEGLAGPKECRA